MPDVNDSSASPKPESPSNANISASPASNPISEPSDVNANTEPLPQIVASTVESKEGIEEVETAVKGVKITEDIRFKKYFKMIQMGVPAAAVKMKMQIEGFDGDFLE